MEHIMGKDIYIDTSCIAEYESVEKFKERIKAHRRDRVLFATDTPWNGFGTAVENINLLDVDDEYKQMIFSENAKKLLDI